MVDCQRENPPVPGARPSIGKEREGQGVRAAGDADGKVGRGLERLEARHQAGDEVIGRHLQLGELFLTPQTHDSALM